MTKVMAYCSAHKDWFLAQEHFNIVCKGEPVAKNTGRGSVVANNAPDKDKFVKAKSEGGQFGKPKSWSQRLSDFVKSIVRN